MFSRFPLLFIAAYAILASALPCDESPTPTSPTPTSSHHSHYHSSPSPTPTTTPSPPPVTAKPPPETTPAPPPSSPSPSGIPSSGSGSSQCNTGPVQCCNSVQPAGASSVSPLLGSLGIIIQNLDTPVGITCTPINLLGVGSGASCTSMPVCCENNNFNGLVNIGCTPINLAL